MMKILFLSHYYPPEGNAPASRVSALAKRWVKAGHEVTVVTCAPNVPDGVVYEGYRNRLRSQESVLDGVRVFRVWTYLAPNKGAVRRILNYVSYLAMAWWRLLFLARPDVLIATSPQFFCGWAGVLGKWSLRLRHPFRSAVPFVLEIRDIWPESIAAVEAINSRRLLRLLEWMEARMYRAADHIVTVGEGYRQRLIQKQVSPDRISVIMNGLDPELFQPDPEGAREVRHRWDLDGQYVCSYSGTIGMACGLDTVLEAAAQLKERGVADVTFLLVGDGAAREALQKEAAARRLDNVVFTGRQPKEQMPAYLDASDVCLVHLKKTDLFATVMPSKIFEAAGMGKPIINGVSGYAAEFVRKAGAGLNIEPENSGELVDALLRLKSDTGRARTLGREGQRYVTTHFNRDQLAAVYLELLKQVSSDKQSKN